MNVLPAHTVVDGDAGAEKWCASGWIDILWDGHYGFRAEEDVFGVFSM